MTYSEYLIDTYDVLNTWSKVTIDNGKKYGWTITYLCEEAAIDKLIGIENDPLYNKKRSDIKFSLRKEYERLLKINKIIE